MRSSMQLLLLAVGLVLIGSVSPVLAQPRERNGMDHNPAQRLRERLVQIDKEREQLNDAIARLDAGEPWEEVRGELPEQRDGRGRKGPRERGRSNMSEERAIELLLEIDPASVQRLEEVRKRSPRFADRLLRISLPKLEQLDRLREPNPPLFEIEAEQFRIERQIMHTARSLHQAIAGVEGGAEDASVDETRAELRDLIARQVDLQIETQRLKLGAAEERLDDLRDSIEARVENRESTIDERVERIMDRAVRGGVERRQRGGDGPPRRRGARTPDQP